MEMEKNPNLPMEKLISFHCILNIFKLALKPPFKILTFIISRLSVLLPLIFTSFVHNLILKVIFNEMSYRVRQLPIDTSVTRWVVGISVSFLKHSLQYMVLSHLLVFLAAASKEGVMKFRGLLLQGTIIRARLKRPLIKFSCVSFVSFSSYVVVVSWCVIGLLKASDFILFAVLYFLSFVATLVKWMEFNAMWNVGVAASNLEGKEGFEALSLSVIFAEGVKLRGLLLVSLLFYWCFETSVSNLHLRLHHGGLVCGGIVAGLFYIGLILRKLI